MKTILVLIALFAGVLAGYSKPSLSSLPKEKVSAHAPYQWKTISYFSQSWGSDKSYSKKISRKDGILHIKITNKRSPQENYGTTQHLPKEGIQKITDMVEDAAFISGMEHAFGCQEHTDPSEWLTVGYANGKSWSIMDVEHDCRNEEWGPSASIYPPRELMRLLPDR